MPITIMVTPTAEQASNNLGELKYNEWEGPLPFDGEND
jgi:hypothetical protein